MENEAVDPGMEYFKKKLVLKKNCYPQQTQFPAFSYYITELCWPQWPPSEKKNSGPKSSDSALF